MGPQSADLAEIVAIELESTSLQVEAEIRPVQVRGSAPDLATLVRNLVDNASRYGEWRMGVRVVEDAGFALLTVDDDGPGVPAADRARIFERFTRLDDSRARASGGVGIGLVRRRWPNGTAAM